MKFCGAIDVLVVLCSSVLATRNETSRQTQPNLCESFICPIYTVENSSDEFEVRVYKGAAWVQVRGEGRVFPAVLERATRALRSYVNGSNGDRRKLQTTVPVMMKLREIDDGFVEFQSLVHLYDPGLNGTRPKPLDRNVWFANTPDGMRVYVRAFRGYVSNVRQIKRQRDILMKSLLKKRIHFSEKFVFFATYNPTDLRHRRWNEVWIKE